MRKTVVLALVAALAVTVAVPIAHSARTRVIAGDNFFKPKKVKIKKGDRVVWRWRGSNPHNVALMKPGSRKVVKRSALQTSGKFAYKFRRAGRWRAVCEVHPTTMRMRVVVRRR